MSRFFNLLAVLGFVALGNIGGDDGDSAAAEGSGEVTYLDIELGALKLEPNHLMAAPGHVILRVKNVDSQVHNLTIDGNVTPDLQPNATTELDLGVLAAGNYEMFCQIPGHKDAGMQGTLMISTDTDMPADGSASGAATDTGAASTDHFHGYNSAEEMQAAMDARALRFVEEQKGAFGGQLLGRDGRRLVGRNDLVLAPSHGKHAHIIALLARADFGEVGQLGDRLLHIAGHQRVQQLALRKRAP